MQQLWFKRYFRNQIANLGLIPEMGIKTSTKDIRITASWWWLKHAETYLHHRDSTSTDVILGHWAKLHLREHNECGSGSTYTVYAGCQLYSGTNTCECNFTPLILNKQFNILRYEPSLCYSSFWANAGGLEIMVSCKCRWVFRFAGYWAVFANMDCMQRQSSGASSF